MSPKLLWTLGFVSHSEIGQYPHLRILTNAFVTKKNHHLSGNTGIEDSISNGLSYL